MANKSKRRAQTSVREEKNNGQQEISFTPELVPTVVCESAQEFVARLRISNDNWAAPGAPHHSSWVFRGHANRSWLLLPSALRSPSASVLLELRTRIKENLRGRFDDPHVPKKGSLQGLERALEKNTYSVLDSERLLDVLCQQTSELMLIDEFVTRSHRIGISVPQLKIPPEVKIEAFFDFSEDGFATPKPFLPNASQAVAQHHGIPTRLLDWTRRPLLAAFFAAEDALLRFEADTRPDFLVVYALETSIVAPFGPKLQGGGECPMTLFTPSHTASTYLRAQDGVFTCDRLASSHYATEGRWVPFDESLFRWMHTLNAFYLGPSAFGTIAPFAGADYITQSLVGKLIRFVLSTGQLSELFALLSREGISRMELMPSLDNVSATTIAEWRLNYPELRLNIHAYGDDAVESIGYD